MPGFVAVVVTGVRRTVALATASLLSLKRMVPARLCRVLACNVMSIFPVSRSANTGTGGELPDSKLEGKKVAPSIPSKLLRFASAGVLIGGLALMIYSPAGNPNILY